MKKTNHLSKKLSEIKKIHEIFSFKFNLKCVDLF